MAHADDSKTYEGPPCERCRTSYFVGTCTHRPRRMPEPFKLSPADEAALEALKCPTCSLPGMKDSKCVFSDLHKSSER